MVWYKPLQTDVSGKIRKQNTKAMKLKSNPAVVLKKTRIIENVKNVKSECYIFIPLKSFQKVCTQNLWFMLRRFNVSSYKTLRGWKKKRVAELWMWAEALILRSETLKHIRSGHYVSSVCHIIFKTTFVLAALLTSGDSAAPHGRLSATGTTHTHTHVLAYISL